jgi:4-nitrophenyl phosphatase
MVGAISASSNVKPHFVVGKPNTYILSQIAARHQVKKDEIVVVGDSYKSDIQMAINYDCRAILVNSEDCVKDENVMIMNDLHEILQSVKEDT